MDKKGSLTKKGKILIEYFTFRAEFLNNYVEPNLMKVDEAATLFKQLKKKHKPTCLLPMNKQSGAKRTYAYFTSIINILIEANSGICAVNYDPKELTSFTKDRFPIRTLSRRVDGAFPDTVNPIAIWEIKEYYYTTTFGSRIADGVYESQLDGMELMEVKKSLNIPVGHYLMVDAYDTWWLKGKSYLCRICDMLHIGILTEALFGKEVVTRVPELVGEWIKKLNDAKRV